MHSHQIWRDNPSRGRGSFCEVNRPPHGAPVGLILLLSETTGVSVVVFSLWWHWLVPYGTIWLNLSVNSDRSTAINAASLSATAAEQNTEEEEEEEKRRLRRRRKKEKEKDDDDNIMKWRPKWKYITGTTEEAKENEIQWKHCKKR